MTGAGVGAEVGTGAEASGAPVRGRGRGRDSREEEALAGALVSGQDELADRLSRTWAAQTVCPQCSVVGLTSTPDGEQAGQWRRGA